MINSGWMDKLFQKKLQNFEMQVNPHVWETIAKKLDEDKRRPHLLGSWWTILLSTLIVFMVIGAGTYIVTKWLKFQKQEQQRNKDLPMIPEAVDYSSLALSTNTNKASLEIKDLNLIKRKQINTKIAGQTKSISTSNFISENHSGRVEQNKLTNHETPSGLSSESESKSNNVNTQTESAYTAQYLTASTDPVFLETLVSGPNSAVYSDPILQDYKKSSEESLIPNTDSKASSVLDGCNVYKSRKPHFFMDVYFSPELANRTLSTNDPALVKYAIERSNSEKPIMSYSIGVRGSFVAANGLTFRGGIAYAKNKERFDFVKERQKITKEIKDKDGNVVSTQVEEKVILDKIYNQYNYLDLPITIGFEKDLKDFILSLNGGIGLNLWSSQSGKIYKEDIKNVYDLKNGEEAGVSFFRKNAGFSLITSVGLNYKYNERILLLLEPSMRYYLHSLSNTENPISQKYVFIGLNIGLSYRIQ